MRRVFAGLRSIYIIVGLLLAVHPASSAEKPNIVLVMADDQGWGDMAYNGHSILKTPHFDKMAKEAIRFDRFYAAAPVCSPTRGSVMTGRHPNRFSCFKWGWTLRPQEITIAEVLKSAGYTTGHFGKWHLGSCRTGSPVNPGASGFDEWLSAENFFDNNAILSRKGRAVQTQGESSMVTVDAALEFIKKCSKKKQPFFAVVWFGSPHSPHRTLPKYRAMYPDQPKGKQEFYGEITAMDEAFGKLRDQLRKMGIHENTILWYCSDNGALPRIGSTGGFRGFKGRVYEGGLLVPALLEWPAKYSKHRVIKMRCNTSDIYPTLVDIVSAKPKKQPPLDGISLVPLLQGKVKVRPKPMGFWDYPIGGISTPSNAWMAELLKAQKQGKEPENKLRLRLDAAKIKKQYSEIEFPGHSAWIDGDWKLHRNPRPVGKKGKNRQKQTNGEMPRFELYDLAKDPYEKTDIAEKHPDRVQVMRMALETWQRSVVRSLNGKDY
ncbi:MAG: sulfatase-like hydrolase/transferase [Gemmataceae bacterium]